MHTVHSHVFRVSLLAVALFVLTLASPHAALAQAGGVGVRAGVSGSPDQFYFGAHADTGPLIDRLSFRPNLEVGLGDHVTTIAANFEFVYWFPHRRQPWGLYAGGGPALNVYRWDAGRFSDSHSETDPGFNLLVGIAHRKGVFAEFKVGLIDSPDIKFGIGYTWK